MTQLTVMYRPIHTVTIPRECPLAGSSSPSLPEGPCRTTQHWPRCRPQWWTLSASRWSILWNTRRINYNNMFARKWDVSTQLLKSWLYNIVSPLLCVIFIFWCLSSPAVLPSSNFKTNTFRTFVCVRLIPKNWIQNNWLVVKNRTRHTFARLSVLVNLN